MLKDPESLKVNMQGFYEWDTVSAEAQAESKGAFYNKSATDNITETSEAYSVKENDDDSQNDNADVELIIEDNNN